MDRSQTVRKVQSIRGSRCCRGHARRKLEKTGVARRAGAPARRDHGPAESLICPPLLFPMKITPSFRLPNMIGMDIEGEGNPGRLAAKINARDREECGAEEKLSTPFRRRVTSRNQNQPPIIQQALVDEKAKPMTTEKNVSSTEALAAQAAVIAKKLAKTQPLFDRLEERVDDVARELRELVGRLVVAPAGANSVPKPSGALGRRRPPVVRKPNAGVKSVLLIRDPDGSTSAQFHDGPRIPLSPLLAVVLEILKADTGASDDHLVGWKSMASIQLALKEVTGRTHGKSSVKELIYNLRNVMGAEDLDRALVENKSGVGYRLAVRRASATTTEQGNP